MKGSWHFVAISMAIATLTRIYNNYWLIVVFILWLCCLFYAKRLRKRPLHVSLAMFLFILIWQPSQLPSPMQVTDEQTSVTFTGEVKSPLTLSEAQASFTLESHETSQRIRINYFPQEKQPSLKEKEPNLDQIKHGATCRITGVANHPQSSRNPGQFDYQDYLLSQGIVGQVTITSLADIRCEGRSLLHPIYELRTTFQTYTNQKLTPFTSAWLHALVLGDRSLLDDKVVALFQRWGMSHILAISGLHIGLIVSLIYFLLVKLNVTTREKAHMLLIAFLPFYAIIAGGQPSVWRASLMVLLFLIIGKFKMRYPATDVVSVVFIILVISDPMIVYHIGFQMSFIVTFALMLSKTWIMAPTSHIFQMMRISFVSQMVILPIQFMHFYTFQPFSILVNTIVVPYFSAFVIPLMFMLLIASFLPAFFINIIDAIFRFIHAHILMLLERVDDVADFPFVFGDFPFVFVLLYYGLLFYFMYYAEKAQELKAMLAGILLSLVIVAAAIRPYFSPVGYVTMLDIGQGDAIVIELPFRQGVFMVDVGSRVIFDELEMLSDREYEQVIKPYLDYRGIQSIDSVFLSHEHIDHIGSMPFMIEDKHVGEIIVSDYYDFDNEVGDILQAADIPLTIVQLDEVIVRNGQTFHVLSPERSRGINENSLVMETMLGDKRWLFTGDMYTINEQFMLKQYESLKIDVLKVAHHGSNTSTDPEFIDQIQPRVSLISVGTNFYGHPSASVIETLEAAGSLVLRTDEHGAIQYRFLNNKGTFFKYLP